MAKQSVNRPFNNVLAPETILPDSISIAPDVKALDVAPAIYFDKVPLDKLLVYDIDNITADALPALAKQFDVLGYKGMRLAATEQDKRNLIKRAIELHRYKGTPWALRQAMLSVGFSDVSFLTNVANPVPVWANFSVIINNQQVGVNAASIAELRKMIEEYKSQRDNLVEIIMIIEENETLDITDDDYEILSVVQVDDVLVMSNKLLYNDTADYDGSYDHSGDSDVIEIT